jgi:hypothetical protein
MLDDIENAGDKSDGGRLLKKPAVCHAKNEGLSVFYLQSLGIQMDSCVSPVMDHRQGGDAAGRS